ncbi:GAF and ANTAR domain-containing protein [Paractinoplanes maris]|uniref:GAF and ANTAR domain-containing protein n=1 Tax=Paractinoplanes maris TaxID=1734446 RepID=UPI00202253CE|nr:GAF and ANTAR domain-containing protein [Actinoplanes maris]
MTQQRFRTSTEAFAELDRLSFPKMRLDDALTHVADVAARAVPGVHAVSATLLSAEGARTAAYTGRVAMDLDEWQFHNGHGPCLAAAAASITVSVPDTAGDRRWPDWADRAVEAGVHSSLSVGLPLRDSVSGALNLYAPQPQNFDDDAVILAETFAGYAAVAMATASRPEDSGPATIPWSSAADRLALEQARGILMAERQCTAEEALRVLREMAAESHRPLRDVTRVLVTRAGWPLDA